MTDISRDPFARTTLVRESVRCVHGETCNWCGNTRHRNGKPTKFLFRYATQHDGGRLSTHTGLFCSRSCHDTYHS